MPINRKTLVYGGVAGAGVLGFLYYRHQKNLSRASAVTTAQASAGYGYGAPDPYLDNGYYGYGASGGFNPTGYYGYGVPSPPGSGVTTLPVANTTNAQWTQAAITQLQNDGYDAQTVVSALGAYETGQPVQAAQVSIIDAAIAVEGYPPVEGPHGFPPAINTQGTPGGGGGGGQNPPPGVMVTVPNVVGMRAFTARTKLMAAGFSVRFSTTPVSTRANYVRTQTPGGGTQAAKGSSVLLALSPTKG